MAKRSILKKNSKWSKRKVVVIEAPRVTGKAQGDALEDFLNMMDDPDDWRKVPDPEGGSDIKISAEELEIIARIQANEYADTSYDPYVPYVDFFTGTVMLSPLSAAPEPKRRFVPSKWEAIKISKIVRGIRKGWIKLKEQDKVDNDDDTCKTFDIWSGETDRAILNLQSRHIVAPKIPLPDHSESYNPPEEYLFTEEERAAWEAMDPEDRPRNFQPAKYNSLRHVPGYSRIINERFGRCLDLFLCPRAIRNKVDMNPDDLLPKLPDPRELRPFPTSKSIEFIGHKSSISALAIDPTGQWLLTAASDGNVKLWDVQTGHCRNTWYWSSEDEKKEEKDATLERISSKKNIYLSWNPNKALFMFAVAIDNRVDLVVPTDMPQSEATLAAIEDLYNNAKQNPIIKDQSSMTTGVVEWSKLKGNNEKGIITSINHMAPVSEVEWHRRGDYFATLSPMASSGAQVVTVHQLSRRTSQNPFKKMPGIIRSIKFHPNQPHLILATQKSVRVYDLVKHQQVKKLLPGVNSVSSLAVHPTGDNVIVGSHDQRLCWFDLDYSVKPYRTLDNHNGAIRSVAFHPSYPLLASAGDDGIVQIIHGQVYADLATNPLIVPVKTLRDFTPGVGITRIAFHPIQPWIFCATDDGAVSLFV